MRGGGRSREFSQINVFWWFSGTPSKQRLSHVLLIRLASLSKLCLVVDVVSVLFSSLSSVPPPPKPQPVNGLFAIRFLSSSVSAKYFLISRVAHSAASMINQTIFVGGWGCRVSCETVVMLFCFEFREQKGNHYKRGHSFRVHLPPSQRGPYFHFNIFNF